MLLSRLNGGKRFQKMAVRSRRHYVGKGLPPVPPKLVERIERGDFIEMCELIPEFWMVHR